MFKKIRKWLALLVDKEVRSQRLEIFILKQQLSTFKFKEKRRPKISKFDRVLWSFLKEHLDDWKDYLVFVKPETVLGWHRKGFKLFWRFKSRGGRPRIPIEQINLIKEMAKKNKWGAPRIQGELKYLGIELALSTIQKYMPKLKKEGTSSQNWMTFLKNHMDTTISLDFFVVPSVLFKPIYGLVVVSHKTREIIYLKLLDSRNEFFIINQLKDIFWRDDIKYIVRDNDPVFGNTYKKYLELTDTKDSPTSVRSPWQNCYCERAIGSVRRELLNKVVILNLKQGNRLLDNYKDYYNFDRPHQGISQEVPCGRSILRDGEVYSKELINGLYSSYFRDSPVRKLPLVAA